MFRVKHTQVFTPSNMMNVTHIPSKTHGKRTAGSHNTVIPYHEISDNTAVFSL